MIKYNKKIDFLNQATDTQDSETADFGDPSLIFLANQPFQKHIKNNAQCKPHVRVKKILIYVAWVSFPLFQIVKQDVPVIVQAELMASAASTECSILAEW